MRRTPNPTRRAPHLSKDETRLFQIINEPLLPTARFKRYNCLKDRRDEETITETELAELIDLTEQMEVNNLPRVEAIIELAEIRRTTPEFSV